MSEPLSSVEIEDVLSSIRRLVSEDLRPVPRGVPAPKGDKLLLTPALRVVSDPESDLVAEPLEAEDLWLAKSSPSTDAPDAEPTVEQVVASVSAAVATQAGDWESETGDAGPVADGTARDRNAQDWADGAPVLAGTDPAEPMDIAQGAPEGVEVWAQQDSGEAFVLQQPELASPPAADPDWVDEAEAEVIAALQPQPSGAAFDDGDEDPDGMTFDEEVLRDLVRDLIREELQGTLGERITRNIRKLVRAEVARALAMQDLD